MAFGKMRAFEVVYGVIALVALLASIVRVYAWHSQKKDMETVSMHIFLIALCVLVTMIAIDSIDPNQRNKYLACAVVLWITTSLMVYTWFAPPRDTPRLNT